MLLAGIFWAPESFIPDVLKENYSPVSQQRSGEISARVLRGSRLSLWPEATADAPSAWFQDESPQAPEAGHRGQPLAPGASASVTLFPADAIPNKRCGGVQLMQFTVSRNP